MSWEAIDIGHGKRGLPVLPTHAGKELQRPRNVANAEWGRARICGGGSITTAGTAVN